MHMNDYDPEKAARVWQRVQGKAPAPEPPGQGLPALMAEVWRDAAAYLYLSRRFPGKDGVLLRRLAEENQSQAACLRGIHAMVTGARPVNHTPPPTQEPAETLLRRCYGRELRRFHEYEARSADPDFGPVFTRLAAQTREHCTRVLELLGGFKGISEQ